MATKTTTRSRGSQPSSRIGGGVDLPPREELEELKLSAEVAWYLISRGIPLPDSPPLIKTPEPGELNLAYDVRFDPAAVDRVLAACGRLRHTKGKWAGQPLKPDPWQVAYIFAPVFGWVRFDEDAGRWVRVIRELYVEIPRKNGKSTTCGAIAIYLTAADGEPGAEVVAAATTLDQAGFVFAPVKSLVLNSPALKPHLKAYARRIVHPASGSYFQVISSAADAQHGANLHGSVTDELHLHKSPDLVDALETGTGSRDQPLSVAITTADEGSTDTIYARKRNRIEQLAARVITAPTVYGVVFAAEESDDPFAETTWRKANPGYGVSPTRAYLEAEATKAKDSPAELTRFLRLHLGIRTKQGSKYIEVETWDDSAGLVDESKLAGRACHGGLDLASVSDVTALCWDFPMGGDVHQVIWRFWIPEDALEALNRRTANNAREWVKQKWLLTTPGNVIDNDFIVDTIKKDAGKFAVKTIGYDRWGTSDVVRRLTDEGLTCVPIGQGYGSVSAPLKEIKRLVLSKRYRHGGNPVMRWMVNNLAVRMDPAGNVKPDKDKAPDKIDGVSAAVNALKECMDAETEAEEFFRARRG